MAEITALCQSELTQQVHDTTLHKHTDLQWLDYSNEALFLPAHASSPQHLDYLDVFLQHLHRDSEHGPHPPTIIICNKFNHFEIKELINFTNPPKSDVNYADF